MKLAAFALAAAVLAAGAAAYTQPAYPHTQVNPETRTMTNQVVLQNTFASVANLPAYLHAGNFTVNAPGLETPKRELTSEEVGCLDTVIPPPLNWGPLYCPGREVKVAEWVDKVGSLHRSFDIPVQPNVTANMVFWLFSPMYPQYLEFEGKKWYWYHLWHPMDHITAANAVFPSSANPLLPGVYTLIHEHYRNTKAEQGLNEWESNAWFFVEDLLSNYLKKRIVITVNQLGMQAWTLIVNLKDTPQGLKIDNELIIGAAAYGHDPTDPAKGVPAETAVIVNDNIIKPALANWASGADFNRSVNAISRHVVEEFSMFRFFLPKVWARYPMLQQMSNFGDFLSKNVPRLNYGLGMAMKPMNTAGVTEMLAPFNRTSPKDRTAMAAALGKLPAALITGAEKNVGASMAATARDAGAVFTAATGANKTSALPKTLARIAIPSAAGDPKLAAARP